MVEVSRAALKAARAVFGRLVRRVVDPAVTMEGGPGGVVLRCRAGGVAVSYRDGGGRGTGAVTVRRPALVALAAVPGRAPVVLRPADNGQVLATTGGQPAGTFPAVPVPVPALPQPDAPPADPGSGFLAALAAAADATGDPGTRFALDKVLLRPAAGQVIGTDARALLVCGGFRLPAGPDAAVPASGVFAAADVRGCGPVRVGRGGGHVVVTAGPWTVALEVDPTARFPDVAAVLTDPPPGGTVVAFTDAGLKVLAEKVPGLPGGDDRAKAVEVELSPPGGVVVSAGGVRVPVPGSKVTGPGAAFATDREYLVRAARTGLRTLAVGLPGAPVVASDGPRRLVWAPLAGPDPIRPAPTPLPRTATGVEDPRVSRRRRDEPPPADAEFTTRVLPPDVGGELVLGPTASRADRKGWSVGGLFRSLVERVKAALAVRAAEELEADARADAARRRAADRDAAAAYEASGHPDAAAELRRPPAALVGAKARARALGAGPDAKGRPRRQPKDAGGR